MVVVASPSQRVVKDLVLESKQLWGLVGLAKIVKEKIISHKHYQVSMKPLP